ncbi:hypothetical protein GCM10027447_29600 [Glycomyces halotolerans]
MRDRDLPVQELQEVARDLFEGRRAHDVGRSDAVEVLGSDVPPGIDQSGPVVGDPAVRVDMGHGDLDDSVLIEQTGGLHIDYRIHDTPHRR